MRNAFLLRSSLDRTDLHIPAFAMMDAVFFKTALVFISALLPGMQCIICGPKQFKCIEGEICIPKQAFCNRVPNCEDGSDENYCYFDDIESRGGCPSSWWRCPNRNRCIPTYFKCDGENDCFFGRDEGLCGYRAKPPLSAWFLRRLKEDTTNRKSPELCRTAIALHLADNHYFAPGNKTGEEVASEVKLQLLTSLTSEMNLKRNELALSIHALMVTCNDPRDFYGFNLVAKLRAQVDKNKAHPYDLLALCNAHDAMMPHDAQKAVDTFNSKNMSFTTDNQALALQALACIQSRTNITLNGTNMTIMEEELKRGQFENGTVGNLRTTALVLQALIASQSNLGDFNFDAAMEAILKSQKADGSFGSLVDSYYVMPLLTKASFLNINNSHCQQSSKNETDASKWNQQSNDHVYYSIRMGDEEEKTRSLYVPVGSSFYDIIEIVNFLDSSQRVQYHVVDGKPYVSSLNEVQEDLEMGRYWYLFMTRAYTSPLFVKESPVDVKIKHNDKLLLWYK